MADLLKPIPEYLKNKLRASGTGLVLPQLLDDANKEVLNFLLKEKIIETVISNGNKLAIDFTKEINFWGDINKFLENYYKNANKQFAEIVKLNGNTLPPLETAIEILTNDAISAKSYKGVVPLDESLTAAGSSINSLSDVQEVISKFDLNDIKASIDKMNVFKTFDETKIGKIHFANSNINVSTSINDILGLSSKEDVFRAAAEKAAAATASEPSSLAAATDRITSLIEELGVKGTAKLAALGAAKVLPGINLVTALATKDVTFILNPFSSIINLFVKAGTLPPLSGYFVTTDKKPVDIPGGLIQLVQDFKDNKFGQKFFRRITDKQIVQFNKSINSLVANNYARLVQLSSQNVGTYKLIEESLIFSSGVVNGSNVLTDEERGKFGKLIEALNNSIKNLISDFNKLNATEYVPIPEITFDKIDATNHGTSNWYYNYLSPYVDLIKKTWEDLRMVEIGLKQAGLLITQINKAYLKSVMDTVVVSIVTTEELNPTGIIDPTEPLVIPGIETVNNILNRVMAPVKAITISRTATKTKDDGEEEEEKNKTKRKRRRNRNKKRNKKIPELISIIDADVSDRSEWLQKIRFKFTKPSKSSSNGIGKLTIVTKDGKSYVMGNFKRGIFSWIVTFGLGTGFGFWSQLPKERNILTNRTISSNIKKIKKTDMLKAIEVELITAKINYK